MAAKSTGCAVKTFLRNRSTSTQDHAGTDRESNRQPPVNNYTITRVEKEKKKNRSTAGEAKECWQAADANGYQECWGCGAEKRQKSKYVTAPGPIRGLRTEERNTAKKRKKTGRQRLKKIREKGRRNNRARKWASYSPIESRPRNLKTAEAKWGKSSAMVGKDRCLAGGARETNVRQPCSTGIAWRNPALPYPKVTVEIP